MRVCFMLYGRMFMFMSYKFNRIIVFLFVLTSIKILFASAATAGGDTSESSALCKALRDIEYDEKSIDPAKPQNQVAIIQRYIDMCKRVLPEGSSPIQALVVDPTSEVYVIGDLHCDRDALYALLDHIFDEDSFEEDSFRLKPNIFLVFLGDFINRGTTGLDVLMLVMGLKIINPNQVFICRGNHETALIAGGYGFFGSAFEKKLVPTPELQLRFGEKSSELQAKFEDLFASLPVAVFIGSRLPGQDKVNFGVYNHAVLGNSDPGKNERAKGIIQSLLAKAAGEPEKIHTDNLTINPEKIDLDDMVWGDYVKDLPNFKLHNESGRGPQCTQADCDSYLGDIEQHNPYIINFQVKGHQHKKGNPGGVLLFNRANGKYEKIAGEGRVPHDKKTICMVLSTRGKGWLDCDSVGLLKIAFIPDGGRLIIPADDSKPLASWYFTPYEINSGDIDNIVRRSFMPKIDTMLGN